ncbi:prepilin peptidase [Tessaracoccus oleiagri]|uniref:Leader peptidase (Prepilin peptidase) / N-methyltransferase n=1 Tax=Tessaracoccus oleiagri TaxID=686624 RepID=A0A1G9JUJ1_9ACTN|nr:A24 family peptidase [Tessaracoccus oleiagri]SDL41161.1 leader peptidase (prepilin peptidase) / N-methyltransferase [Tessaracoccus oleiagri]
MTAGVTALPTGLVARTAGLIVGAVVFVWAGMMLGPSPALFGFGYLAAVWGAAAVIDLQTHHLPDILTLGAYPVFLILMLPSAAIEANWNGLGLAALLGLATALALFIIAFINPAGFGLGDVKLGLSTGAALGWLGVMEAVAGLLAAFVLMAVFGAVALAVKRLGRKSDVAFGPFMIAGVLVAPWLAQLMS